MNSYDGERHIVACWTNALYDMAENLGEVGGKDEIGNEITEAYIRQTALIAKAEGTSTCICHQDDEWYDAHPEHPRPALVPIEDAARHCGFASDLIDQEV